MKPQVTRKSVNEGYVNVISVGYCNLYYLLRHEKPRAYTAGIYGWNADVYEFGGTAVVTGYRPFGDRPSYDLIQKYEREAKAIHDSDLPYGEKKVRLHTLTREFIRDALV